MKKELLIIFVKNPVLGKVKTRLAATLGDSKALQVYNLLLLHTFKITNKLPIDKTVFYNDCVEDDDLWQNTVFRKFIQEGSDLGEKMEKAFMKGFELGYEKICIIGSDCNELAEKHIIKAFEELNEKNIVLGPSFDGGYYLLGLNKMVKEIFYDKNWSTSTVFQDTIKDIQEMQLDYAILEKLHDVDEEKDLSEALKQAIDLGNG